MKLISGVLFLTEDEFDSLPKKVKGMIDSEWSDGPMNKSFMWNRTIRLKGKHYIEGLNMAITK